MELEDLTIETIRDMVLKEADYYKKLNLMKNKMDI